MSSDLVKRLRSVSYSDGTPNMFAEAADRIEWLEASLRGLLADIADYERVNNLFPNPGRQDCWQSVTNARVALERK